MQHDRKPVRFDLAWLRQHHEEYDARFADELAQAERDDATKGARQARYRRVVIEDPDASKPAELLATEFPSRRPNRRPSPRMAPPARRQQP